MRVFDFSNQTEEKVNPECTYTTFRSNEEVSTPEHPIFVLDNKEKEHAHHSAGFFTNPTKRTAFEFKEEDSKESYTADILKVDSRFVSLVRWLGDNHINVRLSGENTAEGYAVYKIREIAFGGGTKLSAEDGFLQFMIDRLLASDAPAEEAEDEDKEELALSIMMNIQWKSNYFEAIDPEYARQVLDEELYGMERVKQRIIETIIQINRTHTLPAYGLLLVGPAGTGKSQIAYAVARILKLPWTTLDMSSINDPEQLTGSSRIYANAKPGIIMEAFSAARESNLVFIINELDKAASSKGSGNPADVLLTLLDNLGFTDNYMECMVPTGGVYPIATANNKDQISAPLMSRFAVIDIPDYTKEEKKIIFTKFSLPKVLRRMGLREGECIVTPEAVEAVVDLYAHTTGIRDLEQAAEHIAANALYRIEVNKVENVTFDVAMVKELFA